MARVKALYHVKTNEFGTMIYGKISHDEVVKMAKNLQKIHGYDCLYPDLATIIGCSVVITKQENISPWLDQIRKETNGKD